jgi:MFS superfamily sulfate permease-like transporter/CRP-like cAMP-binding protein
MRLAARAALPAEAPSWRGELMAGANATAAMLPFVLSYGYIVYGAAGAAAAQIGLTASVVSAVIGALVMVLASRARLPTAAPSASTALILGTLLVPLLQDPALSPATAAGGARLLACTGATVVVAGLLLLALGLLRVGRLARYVPQPALAGFMNGVAILIVLSQLPVLLGMPAPAWSQDGWAALAAWQWPPLVVALFTALLVGMLGWRFPRLPAPLLALVLASLAALAAQAAWPALALDTMGSLRAGWPQPDALAPWFEPGAAALLGRHARAMLTTALLLALIGGLESVLSIAAVDQLLDARTDPDRELRALGIANIVTGLFGGLFLVFLRLRAIATFNGGGRGVRAVLAGCVMLALVFTLALPLVQRLPTAVVAGIVVMLAWTLVDRWTRRLLRQWWRGERSLDTVLSLLVVVLVCAVTLRWGIVVGVAAGVLAAMLIFMRALNRSLLRLRYRASEIPSRRIYPPALEAHLAAQRQRVAVLELEGALFFGNADRLADEVEQLAPAPAFVVLDLRRVSTIDATGAVALAQLGERLVQRGATLWLAGVTPDNRHGRALREQGVQPPAGRWWGHADADRAIEAAEAALLAEAGLSLQGLTVAPEACALFDGLDAAQAVRLGAVLQPRTLAAGERLFTQGDAGDALYLLGSGSVSVLDAARAQRFVSFSPGMCFGETAVLDGGGRTADAVADMPSTVHALPAVALDALQRSDPALAAQVYRNLAQHLSQRLRAAATAWRRAAD